MVHSKTNDIFSRVVTNFLIGRFLFNYIGDTPITRTDEHDFVIFHEKLVKSRQGPRKTCEDR
jgi:hypothetical protein